MIIGYARTSTVEQVAGLEAQLRDLKQAGCEKIFSEQTSSVAAREQLEAAIEWARAGDVIVTTKLDRLARSIIHLWQIIERLETKGVSLRILGIGVDTATPTGRLMVSLLGSVSQFEREIMLERQREGIAKAQSEGRYKGRKPTAKARTAEVLEMDAAGAKREDIAKALGIGIASVYRALATSKPSPRA